MRVNSSLFLKSLLIVFALASRNLHLAHEFEGYEWNYGKYGEATRSNFLCAVLTKSYRKNSLRWTDFTTYIWLNNIRNRQLFQVRFGREWVKISDTKRILATLTGQLEEGKLVLCSFSRLPYKGRKPGHLPSDKRKIFIRLRIFECCNSLQSRRIFGERVLSIFLARIAAVIFEFNESERLGRERNLYQGGGWQSKNKEGGTVRECLPVPSTYRRL